MEEPQEEEVAAAPNAAPALVLVPYNKAAKAVVNDARNWYLRVPLDSGGFGLYVSFANPEKQEFKLGRADTDIDIYLPDKPNAEISRHQCSFIANERGAVLLEDKSTRRNTEPFSSNQGGATIRFARDRRSVLVARGINNMVGLGREKYYQFQIHWESDGMYDFRDHDYIAGPRQHGTARRYIQGERVGGGTYGNVWWVMDVHTGGLMAVKKFHNLEGKNLEFATREIAHLFRINRATSIRHNHILEIFDSAGGGKGDNWGEIFMPLKAGNLKTLVLDRTRLVETDELANLVLHQMLLALSCIAKHGIVHRDIKPENVLWEFGPSGNYHFRLGDFGLSNSPALAVTVAGTEPFMAPEVYHRLRQTEKVDIWSLFATIVWVKNISNFRANCARYSAPRIHDWLVKIAQIDDFANIQRMASMKPKDRPSANQLLRILNWHDALSPGDELADPLAMALTLDPTGPDEDDDPGVGPSTKRRPSVYGKGKGPAVVPSDMPEEEEEQPGDDEEGEGEGEVDGEGRFPGMPYYEPYTPDLDNYDLDPGGYDPDNPDGGDGGPPVGQTPRRPPNLDQAYVAPYSETYGPPSDEDPDSGTAVADNETVRQMQTQEMNELAAQPVLPVQGGSSTRETERDRIRRGKKKSRWR